MNWTVVSIEVNTSLGYELSISPSLTSLLLSFDSVFCHFNSLPECFLKQFLFVVTQYSQFQHFHHFNSSSECFLKQLVVLIVYLSAFLNDLLCCFDILEWLVIMIFLIDISLLFQYSWMTCHYDILDWHLFAFSIVFVFWCLFLTTHIIMTSLNSIFNFSHLADTSNYASWATNIKFILMNKDLWAAVSGTFFESVVELDEVDTLNLKSSSEYIVWSKENNRACVTIALSC